MQIQSENNMKVLRLFLQCVEICYNISKSFILFNITENFLIFFFQSGGKWQGDGNRYRGW